MFMTAPCCIWLGFVVGKRHGANSVIDDSKYICLEGLSPSSVDRLKLNKQTYEYEDLAKRKKWADWMYRRKVWSD